MAWYRMGKLGLANFRTQNPIFQHYSRIYQSGYLDSISKGVTLNRFSYFSSISHNRLGTLGVRVYKNLQNSLLSGVRRFNYVDARPKHWYQSRGNVFIVMISGVLITVYFWNLETIPYTQRTHWILVSKAIERKIGEKTFERWKVDHFKGNILPVPPNHPDSVRVRKILKEIIDALPATSHLKGLNWEVTLVNDPKRVNAMSFAGEKILVTTGLLGYFGTDEELAVVLGHEVAHLLARHPAEIMTKSLWFAIRRLIDDRFEARTFNKMLENEADYIGMLLSASAGYDPRVAPTMYEKVEGCGSHCSHPSGKERAKLLRQDKIMEEALGIYRNAIAGR